MALLRRNRKQFRPITEAEAYARCHGERDPDFLGLRVVTRPRSRFPVGITGETLRRDFERRLEHR
jgi:hypothetical protein